MPQQLCQGHLAYFSILSSTSWNVSILPGRYLSVKYFSVSVFLCFLPFLMAYIKIYAIFYYSIYDIPSCNSLLFN